MHEILRGRTALVRSVVVTVLLVAVLALPAVTLAAGPEPPLVAARYSLTVDGVEIASFNHLVDLTGEIGTATTLESTDKEVIIKQTPSKAQPPTLTLTRGMTRSMELWDWFEATTRGDLVAARKNATLTMFGADGRPVARFQLVHAWPSKIEVGAVQSGSTDTLSETVTFTCETLDRT